MEVVVAGATGFIGSAVTQALLDRGHRVVVLSRNAEAAQGHWHGEVTARQADVTDSESLTGALEGADVVVDAVQFPNSPIENPGKGYTFAGIDLAGTKNLVAAAKEQGVGRFIGISGAGAAEDAPYHWLRYKWEEEQAIAASGIAHVIFRPSWVYGPGDVSLNRFLGFARFLPFVPVIGNGGKIRINPLFIDDIGKHVAAAVDHEAAAGRVFEIGGPETLTMNEVIRTALSVAGKRRFLLPQPKWLMKPVASVVQFLPGRPLTPGAIDFITMDGVVDNTDVEAAFGLPLTPLEEGLRTYLPR